MVGRIHARLGIGVLPPGTAHLSVFLHHLKGKAHFLQAKGRAQPGESGTDHQRLEVLEAIRRRRRVPVDTTVPIAHFLHGQGRVLSRHALA